MRVLFSSFSPFFALFPVLSSHDQEFSQHAFHRVLARFGFADRVSFAPGYIKLVFHSFLSSQSPIPNAPMQLTLDPLFSPNISISSEKAVFTARSMHCSMCTLALTGSRLHLQSDLNCSLLPNITGDQNNRLHLSCCRNAPSHSALCPLLLGPLMLVFSIRF